MLLNIFKYISYAATIIFLLLLIAAGVVLFAFKGYFLFLLNDLNSNINKIINEADSAFQNIEKFDYNAVLKLLEETIAPLEAQLNNPNIDSLPPEIKNILLRSIAQLKQVKLDINNLNLEEVKNQIGSILVQVKQINSENISPVFAWINTYYQTVSLLLLILPSSFLVLWSISGIFQIFKNENIKKRL
ncbi:MAG: hypothetical protein ACRDBR_01520 [Metamycoplasmataceae bacterium]